MAQQKSNEVIYPQPNTYTQYKDVRGEKSKIGTESKANEKSKKNENKLNNKSKVKNIKNDIMNKYQKNIRADFLYAKIHRATVTDSNLNYMGSISLDSTLMNASGILEGMKVDILNINNGERFSTYAIKVSSNNTNGNNKNKAATVCLNGAAARKVQAGDTIIIIAYANIKMKHASKIKPKVVFVDSNNMITEIQE